MRWIVGSGKEIFVSKEQMLARKEYIRRVTDSEVSSWSVIQVNGPKPSKFYWCTSNDEVEGTFITAHIDDVYILCSLPEVYSKKLVIANTCIWVNLSHKNLLHSMMSFNRHIELWFAKQELSVDATRIFRQSSTINNVGQFGFQTSFSERELFKNRGRGLMEAISESFTRVSPVILLGD